MNPHDTLILLDHYRKLTRELQKRLQVANKRIQYLNESTIELQDSLAYYRDTLAKLRDTNLESRTDSRYCKQCGGHFANHNDDGSCVLDHA